MWSPDGTKLAWLLGTDLSTQIRILTTDGAAPPVTLESGYMNAPIAWSPDGTKIYGANEGRTFVTVVTVDRSAPNVRISHPRAQSQSDWQRLAP